MEMGLRRVVIIPIIIPIIREEEEDKTEFKSLDCFYRDARYYQLIQVLVFDERRKVAFTDDLLILLPYL